MEKEGELYCSSQMLFQCHVLSIQIFQMTGWREGVSISDLFQGHMVWEGTATEKMKTDKYADKCSLYLYPLISFVAWLWSHHQLLYLHTAKSEALSAWLDVNGPLTVRTTGSCKEYIF